MNHSPERFARLFNKLVPGAYRKIDAQDVRDMAECGLIGRYGYYGRADLETVRAILQYEQLRDERNNQPCKEQRRCKRCGQSLINEEGKKGRPREYFQSKCEQYRNRDRHLDWKARHVLEPISKK